MAVLKYALVTPRGVVLVRPLRLLMSPFSREGVAMQVTQPWVSDLATLSDVQVGRIKALITAARGAAGTFGTVLNPKTGKMMPAIAAKVRDTIAGKITPEERIAHRRTFAKRYRLERKPRAKGYLELLARIAKA